MKTYNVEFTMTFHGTVEADNWKDAEAKLDAIGTGDVWDGQEWDLYDTDRVVTDCADGDDEEDDDTQEKGA